MNLITLRSLCAITCLSLLAMTPAQAAIKIGLVLPLTGPLASTGNDIAQGSIAAIDRMNLAGGIKGQRIELIVEDDRFDAKLSEELARNMAKTKGASAFLSCFGTVNCLAIAKVAQETGVPLLGPIAGAQLLRDAKQTKVYSVRADASQEVGVLLKYLSAINQHTAAVIVQDDGFGNAYASAMQSVAAQYGFKPSLTITFDPKTPNYAQIAKRAAAGTAVPSVLLIANTVHSVGIIKALDDAKYYGQVLNLAGQANGGFVKGLSKYSQVAVFATVTPSPFGENSPAAQSYRTLWKTSNANDNYSYIGFEAFLNAELLVAALKRSNGFSPAALDQALSSLNKVKLYELNYSFAGKQRQAASFTDLAVLSEGTFKH